MATSFVPIQVKARAKSGYNFQRSWFDKVPGVVPVHVWNLVTTPEFYIFDGVAQVEDALGTYAKFPSWKDHGIYSVTEALDQHYSRMKAHRDQWRRIFDQIFLR
jgi:hypothetical protein